MYYHVQIIFLSVSLELAMALCWQRMTQCIQAGQFYHSSMAYIEGLSRHLVSWQDWIDSCRGPRVIKMWRLFSVIKNLGYNILGEGGLISYNLK
jgi:hypothetical protein